MNISEYPEKEYFLDYVENMCKKNNYCGKGFFFGTSYNGFFVAEKIYESYFAMTVEIKHIFDKNNPFQSLESDVIGHITNIVVSKTVSLRHGFYTIYPSNIRPAFFTSMTKLDGLHERYYLNGQIESRGFIIGGKRNGMVDYWRFGRLEKTECYIFGKRHGMTTYYDKDKNIVMTEYYENDVIVNSTKIHKSSGGIHRQITEYKDEICIGQKWIDCSTMAMEA